MRLRSQLLMLALATLLLPWAGCQTVRELEQALREGQAQTLGNAATAIAAAIEPGMILPAADEPRVRGETLYAHALAVAPDIDGYDANWPLAEDARHRLGDGVSWVRLGRTAQHLYLFINVVDDTVLFQRPASAGGMAEGADRVILKSVFAGDRQPGRYLFAAEAPGAFTPRLATADWQATTATAATVLAHWQPHREGYQVEIRVPRALVGERLGIGFIDIDAPGGPAREVLSWSHGYLPGRIVAVQPALSRLLQRHLAPGIRAQWLDAEGWRLASAGELVAITIADEQPAWSAVRNRLFTWWLQGNEPARPDDPREPAARVGGEEVRAALGGERAVARYRSVEGTVLSIGVPLSTGGVLLLEQGSAEIITLTNRTLTRVLTFALGSMGLLTLLLLGYASWLSWRIGRLSMAAHSALGPRGELALAMPGTRRGDELGDLARSVESLLRRVSGYTGYLRGLGGKLSHELKTPLAVVSSSLENLRACAPDGPPSAYLERASEGTARLQTILALLSEATQAEEMVANSTRERYHPAAVVESCARAYRELHPERRLTWSIEPGEGHLEGSPDLLAQALDKLVDNAVDFTPVGGRIELALRCEPAAWRLSVRNDGPPLPAELGQQLFDSLVSARCGTNGRPHLGLGLYIVRLIAEFHHGRASAQDVAGGVCMQLALPVIGELKSAG